MNKEKQRDENYLRLLKDISKIIDDGRKKTQDILKNSSSEIKKEIFMNTSNPLLKNDRKNILQ